MSSKLNPTRSYFGTTGATTTLARTPDTKYASVVRTSPLQSSSAASVQTNDATMPKPSIYLNARNQRVDHPIRYSSRENIDRLKRKKLCNQFHILGNCSFGDGCTHTHGPKLSSRDIVDLTHIARLSACANGLFCKEANCVCGHRCPRDTCCGYCKFPDTMHGVDTTIVDTI